MKKIPKLWLWVSIGLLATSASCEKNTTTPLQQDFNCVTDAEYKISIVNRDVIMTSPDGKDWTMQPDTNDVLYNKESLPKLKPCGKIPTEILKQGLKITITGRLTNRSTQSIRPVYEYFILENFNIKAK